MKIRIIIFITTLLIIIFLYVINFYVPLIGFIPESLILILINIITYFNEYTSIILDTLNEYLGDSVKDEVKNVKDEKLDKRKLIIISAFLIGLLIIVNLHNNNWDLYNYLLNLTDFNTFLEERLRNTSEILETTLNENTRFRESINKIIDRNK